MGKMAERSKALLSRIKFFPKSGMHSSIVRCMGSNPILVNIFFVVIFSTLLLI